MTGATTGARVCIIARKVLLRAYCCENGMKAGKGYIDLVADLVTFKATYVEMLIGKGFYLDTN
jgi:hypothetical protein